MRKCKGKHSQKQSYHEEMQRKTFAKTTYHEEMQRKTFAKTTIS